MATDNPRAVDDLTLSKSKKDPLNRVVFYISALIILIFSLVTFCLTILQIEQLTPYLRG